MLLFLQITTTVLGIINSIINRVHIKMQQKKRVKRPNNTTALLATTTFSSMRRSPIFHLCPQCSLLLSFLKLFPHTEGQHTSYYEGQNRGLINNGYKGVSSSVLCHDSMTATLIKHSGFLCMMMLVSFMIFIYCFLSIYSITQWFIIIIKYVYVPVLCLAQIIIIIIKI